MSRAQSDNTSALASQACISRTRCRRSGAAICWEMGKQDVSREEFLTKIGAAVIAGDLIPGGSDFVSALAANILVEGRLIARLQVIIGRTDSAQVLGMEEAVIRLKLAADAGADVCFIEGVKTEELLRSTVAALAPKPVRPDFCFAFTKLTAHS